MQIDKDYFKLHFVVLLWGFTAIIGLLISINFIELVFYRTLISFIALWFILRFTKTAAKATPKQALILILTGSTIAIHWILFFGAARYSNASVSLIGLSTTTLWTSLMEPLVQKRKISLIEVAFALLVILGLYIIYKDDFSYSLGLVMSLGSAMLAAFFTVMNHSYVRKQHHSTIVFYEMFGAWLTTIPFLWILAADKANVISLPTASDWGYLFILALVCTVYANAEATKLLKKFSAFASNLVITMEPVYGILLALLFFGKSEQMKPGFYLGTLVIIAAVVLYPTLLKRISRERR